MDLPQLYQQMLRARLFEFAVKDLWEQGRISAEMHLGTGEEAIAAGVVTHLCDGDGLAVTHRSSPPFIVRGVPLVPILRELLGKDDGLCHGRGGHMHLHSKPHLAAASGIVGASVPTAAGFALAATRLRRGAVGLAFTGTGAMNAGMVLETLNLAKVWNLPLIVVCVDNDWAITTPSDALIAGSLVERAEAFGWRSEKVDGRHVERVHVTAGQLIEHARGGGGPAFLLAPSPRLDGHHLGDALMRTARHPIREGSSTMRQLISTVIRGPGEPRGERIAGLRSVMATLKRARATPLHGAAGDPVAIAAATMDLNGVERDQIETEVELEIAVAVAEALRVDEGPGDA